MSNLPISSKYRSTPAGPVDDGEREDLTRRLNDAYTQGVLSEEDWRGRLDLLYGAHTLGELVPVVQGLPSRATFETPSIVEQDTGRPGELAQARDARRPALVAVGVLALLLTLLAIVLVLVLG